MLKKFRTERIFADILVLLMKREHLREGPEALRSLLKGDFLVIIIRIRTIDIMVDKTLHLLQKL